MRKIIFLLACLGLLLQRCNVQKRSSNPDSAPTETTELKVKYQALPPHTKTAIGGSYSYINGTIVDEHNEPLPFVQVVLHSSTGQKVGAYSDIDGRFEIKNVTKGDYHISITAMGYKELHFGPLKLDDGIVITFEMIQAKEIEVIVLKPIIYLYPDSAMPVHVSLDYAGQLIHTYPRYPRHGWHVWAKPDGTLYDDQQREYYALYWEGSQPFATAPVNGNVVAAEETIPFLESALSRLGLSPREANEFILYWLPQLEKNPYNLIHFATDQYAKEVPMHIDPQPDVVIRIMMTAVALQRPVAYPEQTIPQVAPARQGFCVVEWGGQWLPYSALRPIQP